jgi:hypothetical protein
VHERGLGVEAFAVGRRADLEVEVDFVATPPIFLGSPKVSRPPTVDCSVVIGMNSAYSPSTFPCRARTPNQPAPNTGIPVPMLTVAKRIRARGSLGSSGGGNTARITSRSVSHHTVTAVDQIFAVVASISRLRCCSGTRAPYRVAAIDCSLSLRFLCRYQALMTCSWSNALHVESEG